VLVGQGVAADAAPGEAGDEGGGIAKADAAALVAGLAWRGIRGYPLTDDH